MVLKSNNFLIFNPIIIKIIVIITTFFSASNIINDYFDYQSDKINHPYRAMPKGLITLRSAFILSIILYIIGIYFSLSLNIMSQKIIFYYILPVIVLYSPVFKKKPLLGNILISTTISFVFIYTEVVLTGILYHSIVPAYFAFHINLIREIIKDIEDIKGDKKVNIKTFPIKYGMNISNMIIKILMISLCFMAPLPYILGIYNLWNLISITFGVILFTTG